MPLETLLRLADDSLPTKELDELIARYCPTIPEYASTLETRKAEVIVQNRNAAELNLTKEPRLNEGLHNKLTFLFGNFKLIVSLFILVYSFMLYLKSGRMALEDLYSDIRKEVDQYDSYYTKLIALQGDRTDLNALFVMLDSSSKSTNERAKVRCVLFIPIRS